MERLKQSRCRLFSQSRFVAAVLVAGIAGGLATPLQAGQELPFNKDWQFHLGEIESAPPYAVGERSWQQVQLPHDWSIERPRAAEDPSEGGGGFFESGTGIYQNTFLFPEKWQGKRVVLHFEGIARESEVWLNGQSLGSHVNAYTPAIFDLTDHLDPAGPNTVTVKVDNSGEPASRWYTGSGLYRPVWLEASDPLHIPFGGLAVRTRSLEDGRAVLEIEGSVQNDTASAVKARLDLNLYDPEGRLAGRTGMRLDIPAGGSAGETTLLEVSDPAPWSTDTPQLYSLRATVFNGEAMVDRKEARVGIRTIEISPESGLLINGQAVELLGANVHHDYGPLGAAVFPAAAQRKARILKNAGFNAVRTAHNPPSTEFLKACDEIGLLVMDEAFDTWKVAKVKYDYSRHFEDHWREDLRTLVLRDRNHPSVILWSTGNEMYDRGKDYAPELSRQMVALVKSLDPGRPVTAGINGLGTTGEWSDLDPLFGTFDLAGYNYELHRYAEDHQRVPGRIIYASESYLTEAFGNWKIIHEADYVVGEFIWSGLDYLGEAAIGRVFLPGEEPRMHWEGSHWPWHGAACGDIDLLGHRRPVSHYRNIVWDKGEKLYLAVVPPVPGGGQWQPTKWAPPPAEASWTWPGHEGEVLTVEVYSRHDKVRLYCNGKLIGEAETGEEEAFKAVFELPYQPGQLTAEGLTGDEPVQQLSLETAGDPAAIWLAPESGTHKSDSSDVIFVDVQIVDGEGRNHPAAALPVKYEVHGPAVIQAIGSADLATEIPYGANPRPTFQGRALVVLRPTGEAGDITLTASSSGLESASVIIRDQ